MSAGAWNYEKTAPTIVWSLKCYRRAQCWAGSLKDGRCELGVETRRAKLKGAKYCVIVLWSPGAAGQRVDRGGVIIVLGFSHHQRQFSFQRYCVACV